MGHKKGRSMNSTTSTETDGLCIICPNCERPFARVDLLTEHVSFARCAGTGTGQTTTKKKKRTGRAANTKTKSTKKHKK